MLQKLMRKLSVFFIINILILFGYVKSYSQTIEGVGFTNGEHRYNYSDTIISPLNPLNTVSFTDSARVSFKTPKPIYLRSGFKAVGFKQGGYYTASFPFDVYLTVNRQCNSSDGTITPVIYGGVPAYTYLWSTSATTSSITYSNSGLYSVTITDDLGVTSTAAVNITTPYYSSVYWTENTGVQISNDTIKKIFDTGWGNSGAISRNKIESNNDGFAEYRITLAEYDDNIGFRRFWGMSDSNSNANYNTIDFAFYFEEDSVEIRENGISKCTQFKYFQSDIFRIERSGDTIKYIVNGVVFQTSIDTINSEKELMVDVSLFNENAYFSGIRTSGCPTGLKIDFTISAYQKDSLRTLTANVTNGMPPYFYTWNTADTSQSIKAYTTQYNVSVSDSWESSATASFAVSEPVSWTVLDSTVQNHDTLFSAAIDTNWVSGALSRNIIPYDGSGFIKYIVTDSSFADNSNKQRIFGFSSLDYNEPGKDNIDFAFFLDKDSLRVFEYGIIGTYGTYAPGDTLIISLTQDPDYIVNYIRNSDTLYQEGAWSANYWVDASLAGQGSYLDNVEISVSAPMSVSVVKSQEQDDSLMVSFESVGGIPPCSNYWDNNQVEITQFQTQKGYYPLGISDALENYSNFLVPIDSKKDKYWISNTGLDVSNDTISKSSSYGGFNCIMSDNVIKSFEDGFVEYNISYEDYKTNNTERTFGFTYYGSCVTNTPKIKYGYYFNADSVSRYELFYNKGSYVDRPVGGFFKFKPNDVLQVLRQGDSIFYLRNHEIINRQSTDNSSELRLEAEIKTQYGWLAPIMVSFRAPLKVNYDIVKECGSGTGTISLNIERGSPPYTYSWNTSDTTDTINFTESGKYTVTVTDNIGVVKVKSIDVLFNDMANVEWIDQDSVLVTSDTIQSLSFISGHSGAVSKNILTSNSNGLIDYRIANSDYGYNYYLDRFLGFSDRNTDNLTTSIDYGYWFNQDTLRVVENDSVFDIAVAYKVEDHCQILRSNDSIIYKLNSDTLRITTTDPAKELMVDVSFGDNPSYTNAYFKGIKATFCPLPLQVFSVNITNECLADSGSIKVIPTGGTPPYTYLWSTSATTQSIYFNSSWHYIVTITDSQSATVIETVNTSITQTLANVSWINLYNTEVISDTLRKLLSATDTVWNANAVSENILKAGEDGFVQINITKDSYYDNSEKQMYIGLNDRNIDSSYVGMDYAWYFNGSEVRIFAEGIFRMYDLHYVPGDKFVIERDSSMINYKINDSTFYSVTTDLLRELFVEASFYNREAYLAEVKTSFCKPVLGIFMADIKKDCDSSSAIISIIPEGGQSPYSYAWSTSATTSSVTVSSTGNYYVTVTDDSSNIVIDTIYVDLDNTRSLVKWNSIDSVSINTDTVTCISGYSYNAGMAYSSNKLEAGENGYVEWYETKSSYIDNQDKFRSIGFADFNDENNKYKILYGAYFNGYKANVIANSEVVIDSGSYKPGDILRIERNGDSIYFKVNDDTAWIAKTDPSRELTLFTSLLDSGAYFHNIKAGFCAKPLQIVAIEKSKACNSSTAYLQVLVSGGKEPYEYLWSTSDTTEVTDYTTNGTYSVTITDAESNTSVSSKIVTTDILAHVNWINIDSCIVDSAALRSNQYALDWTASAYALNTLTSGNDGEMQYYISKEKYSNNCNKQLRLGLTDGEPTSSSILDYAWYFSSDTLSIYENDTLRIDSIDYNAGDLLTIKRAGDTIKYLINDTIYRTKYSTTISDQNLKVYAKIYDPGTSLNGVKTTFCPENIQVAWYEATRSCDEDSGRIDINVIGGVPPYEYNWSNNDSTATTYYNTNGNYTVTVTDSWGDTSTLTANISTLNNAVPQWYNYTGYSISTDSIIKTTDGSNWSYAAITSNRIDKGDNGNISFLETKGDFADNKTLFRRIGLADIMDDSTNFSYGWLLDEDSLKIIENTTIYNIGLYGDADRLTVKRDGDTIRYVKNTTTVRSVFTDTNRILVGKVSSYNHNGYFSHVRISVCPAPEILVNHILTKVSPDSLGDVTTQITQGVAPYTYHWSTGVTTSGINDMACGLYKITVTDSVGYHTVSNIYVSDKVSWTSLVGIQASFDTIERTDTINGWQCGAATANTLRNGLDGAIIYKVSDTLDYDKIKVLGLANSSPNTAYDLINYAFYFREDTVAIYESGEMKIELGKYTTNDEFVIARQGDSIRYFKNNVLLRERSTNSNNELHGYASLYSSEASFKGIRATFLPASSMLLSYHVDSVINGDNYLLKLDISGGATPYVYEWSNGHTSDTLTTTPTGYRVSVTDKLGFMSEKPVMLTPVSWINTDSTSVSNDRLYADHSQALWHAGAFSGNTLAVGNDGFVFYQSTDNTNNTKVRVLGFSTVEQNVSDTTVNYGFLFDEDTLKIIESGIIIDTVGKYNTTDRFHIFRSGLDIKYMYNDAIVREMTDSSLAEKSLLVDVSFKSPDASFENVMTSFSYPASLHIAHTLTPIDDRTNINLTVTGGLSPYTYIWNNGKDTSSVTNLVTGEYIVTVTDFVGTSQTKTFYLFEDVSWIHRDSTTISGDTLLKSTQYGTEMNSWGTASNILNSYRNGAVEYTVSNTGYTENNNKERAFGLSNSTDNLSSDIDYAFVLNKDELQISESGAIKYDNLEYTTGDNLQIIRTGNYVKYYKNDTLLREISVANSYALVAKAGFSNRDAYFDHLKVSFVVPMLVSYKVTGFRQDSIFNTEITATNGYSPYSYSWGNGSITDTSNILPGRYAVTVTDSLTNSFAFNVNLPNVIWTSLDSAIVGGDTLYEYAIYKGSGIGIGSAFSTNIIRSNTDGFLSYGESTNSYNQNVNIRRAIGLSETNGIDRYNSIMYGYNFYKDSVYVIESGVSRTLNVKYNAGDVFNIERKDALLTYYINDSSVRQIVVDKSKVLYADVALGPNGYIESVVMNQYPDIIIASSTINRYNETKGTVNLAVSGGLAPYTMNWSNGSIQDTITNLTAGIYRVTVTDAAENTKTNTYPIVRNTLWKNMVGLSFNSDTLRKTTGTSGWTAGALARNFLPAYNQGYVIYKDNSTSFNANNSKKRMFGLSTENSGADSSTIKYAFMLDGTSLKIYENGSYIQSCGTYSANKSNYILRSNDTVYYYKNGVLQKTTIVDPGEVLYPDVSIYTPQAYFLNIQASFELPEIAIDYTVQNKTAVTLGEITVIPSQGTPPYTYDWNTTETTATIDDLYPGGYNVTVTDSTGLTKSATVFVMGNMIWNNHNHTVLSNDTVYKLNNTYSWDADAVSANILQANVDGAIEFAVTNTTDTLNRRCVGLTTGNINSNPYTIDYRFFIDGKQISAFNKGEKLGTFGNFAAGDTFRIARTGSQIKYYRDKEVLATITIDPAEELMTDVAFYEDSAYFDHVLASFSDSTFDLVPYKPIYAGTTVNIYPDKDATVMEAYPTTNYGNNDYFLASKGSSSGTKGRSLMDFDVTWIPENAVITNATLYLQTNALKGHSVADNQSALVMNDTLWYEDSVTWNNKPDLDTTGVGYIDVPASDSSFQNYSIDIKKFVDAWHNGTKENYGFTFSLLNESSASEMVFEATEAADSIRRPRVEISYYVPVKLVATMYPNVDATIYNIDSTTTNATNNTFMASSDTTGNDAIRRSLMKFDLSVIPPNAIIDSARLYLYGTDHSGNNAACLKRVTTNWYEDSVTWKTQPTTDIRQQLTTSQTASATEDDTLNLKEMVQNWVDGTYANYGLLLKLQNENIIARLKYGSSDNTDTTIVPKLEVFYTIQPLEVPYVIETDTVDSTNTVRIAAYGGTPPYTYRWSDGSTTRTIENMDYGTSAVTVTDAWGSWAVRDVIVERAINHNGSSTLSDSKNWKQVKVYNYEDENSTGTVLSESRTYMDLLGRADQTQTKVNTIDKVITSQVVNDVYGRPVLQTLPAVVSQSSLDYVDKLIANPEGSNYSYNDFDKEITDDQLSGEVNNPLPVSSTSALGKYYSNNNTDEPFVATTSYPYSRIEYSKTIPGLVKRSSIAGNEQKFGSGHESQQYVINSSSTELYDVYGISGWMINSKEDPFEQGIDWIDTLSFIKSQLLLKQVSIDNNGEEMVSYQKPNGMLIATCKSGQRNGENVRTYDVSSTISSDLKYVDIHLPKGCSQELTLDYVYGGTYDIIDLKTDKIIYKNLSYSNVPGWFNYISTVPCDWLTPEPPSISLADTVANYFECEHEFITNADGSIYEMSAVYREDFLGLDDPIYTLAHAYLKINNLVPGFYRIVYNNEREFNSNIDLKYKLNYYNFSLNYYNQKGDLVKNIPPSGVDYDYNRALRMVSRRVRYQNDDCFEGEDCLSIPTSPLIPNNGFKFYDVSIRLVPKVTTIINEEDEQIARIGSSANGDVYKQVLNVTNLNQDGKITGTQSVFGFRTFVSSGDSLAEVRIKNDLITSVNGDTISTFNASVNDRSFKTPVAENQMLYSYDKTLHILNGNSTMRLANNSNNQNVIVNSEKATSPLRNENITHFKFLVPANDPLGNVFAPPLPNSNESQWSSSSPEPWNNYIDYDGTTPLPVTTEGDPPLTSYAIEMFADIKGIYSDGHEEVFYSNVRFGSLYDTRVTPYPNSSISYYVIDSYGYPTRVIIPPQKVEGLVSIVYSCSEGNGNGGNTSLSFASVEFTVKTMIADETPNHTMASTYSYNSLGQVTTTVKPDEGKTEFLYKTNGSLRFSQNAKQRATNKYSYVNYDRIGRVIETGEASGASYTFSVLNGETSIPANCTQQNYISYDIPYQSQILALGATYNTAFYQRFVTGRVSKTWNSNAATWYSYDEQGRLEWIIKLINGLGVKTLRYKYDFAGKVTQVISQELDGNEHFVTKYFYDSDGRLLTAKTNEFINGNEQAEKEHGRYYYYEHGPLKRVELANNLQGIDYIYTINGWLKSINSPDLGKTVNGVPADPGRDGFGTSDINKDVFGMALDYYHGDYVRNGGNGSSCFGTNVNTADPNTPELDNYNGIVKSSRWKIDNQQVDGNQLPSGSQWAYTYKYDEFKRLTEALFGTYMPDNNENAQPGLIPNTDFNSVTMRLASTGGKNQIELTNELQQIALSQTKQSNANYYNLWGGLSGTSKTSVGFTESQNVNYFNVNNIVGQALSAAFEGTTLYKNTNSNAKWFKTDIDDEYKVWGITYNGTNNGSLLGDNGNISTMNRNGYGNHIDMDRLSYTYQANTNKLRQVGDASTCTGSYDTDIDNQTSTTNYAYSNIGELNSNVQENRYYEYNVYKKVTKVYDDALHTNLVLEYFYDDLGQVYKMAEYSNNRETWYHKDASGKTIAIYVKEGANAIEFKEIPIYGLSRLGTFYKGGSYNYEITDNLGNMRVLIKDNGGVVQILATSDYDPWGMEMPGRCWVASLDYRHGYQGQFAERNPVISGTSDFMLRQYDARIGRWTTTDPYGQGFSPYVGMGNNPVMMVDENGGIIIGWAERMCNEYIDAQRYNTFFNYYEGNYALGYSNHGGSGGGSGNSGGGGGGSGSGDVTNFYGDFFKQLKENSKKWLDNWSRRGQAPVEPEERLTMPHEEIPTQTGTVGGMLLAGMNGDFFGAFGPANGSSDPPYDEITYTDATLFGVTLTRNQFASSAFFNPFTNTINIPDFYYKNEEYLQDAIMHEFGHYLQLTILEKEFGAIQGFNIFITKIGIPSVSTRKSPTHMKEWYELNASNLGKDFFGTNYVYPNLFPTSP